MYAYRVQLKVLQRRDDEGVVGRVAQDAVDVASQARVVAHESREAYGDTRPRWRDRACRQCHACARAREATSSRGINRLYRGETPEHHDAHENTT